LPYNLASPNGLIEPPDPKDPAAWYFRETAQILDISLKNVLNEVGTNIDHFVRWPGKALLLWNGCDRKAEEGKKQKYHKYPAHLKSLAKTASFKLDTRPNGPAIASFIAAGGDRPIRFGSSNRWSIHHLYSGKFPFPGRQTTKHASKSAVHFTQSAGLVAVHPIADSLVDEFPFFTWFLRLEAFSKFGYDPDSVFSVSQDEFGFCQEYSTQLIDIDT
jgi:hypothetical protein